MRSNRMFTFFMYSRYNNLFKGVSWVVASSIIGSVLQFLLIFVLLNFYKQEEFGLWASVTSIAAVIVTGDFNAVETEDPIQVLIDRDNVDHLTDSRSVADLKYGPEWTFHGFGRIPLEKRHLIDYIFIKGNIKVLRHGVLTDTLNHLYPSDHCPIMCVIEI